MPKTQRMPKTKIGRKATEGVGRGYGRTPLNSPNVGGPGKTKRPVKA